MKSTWFTMSSATATPISAPMRKIFSIAARSCRNTLSKVITNKPIAAKRACFEPFQIPNPNNPSENRPQAML